MKQHQRARAPLLRRNHHPAQDKQNLQLLRRGHKRLTRLVHCRQVIGEQQIEHTEVLIPWRST